MVKAILCVMLFALIESLALCGAGTFVGLYVYKLFVLPVTHFQLTAYSFFGILFFVSLIACIIHPFHASESEFKEACVSLVLKVITIFIFWPIAWLIHKILPLFM